MRSATISIGNTDSDENPYGFAIEGTGFLSLDFGDAPDGTAGNGMADYDTLLDNDGPRHGAIGPTLGSQRDGESDGLHSLNADGDDAFGEIPGLRIIAGGTNTMVIQTPEGIEFDFDCFVEKDMSKVVYELRGTKDGQLVSSHMGTVRYR